MPITRPHLLVTQEPSPGLRTLDELRSQITTGHMNTLWREIHKKAQEDCADEAITAFTPLTKRTEQDTVKGNAEFIVTHEAGSRVTRCALAAMLTGEQEFRDAALRQVEALFDEKRWPTWQDQYHLQKNPGQADLRTGQLCRDLGLAFDWLHPQLSPSKRKWWVQGVDRRGIQIYLRSIEAGAEWATRPMNWMTVIVGGLGTLGMALMGEHPQAQQLVDFATERMQSYMDIYGPEGEFNENVGYAGSTGTPVAYMTALRYHKRQRDLGPAWEIFRKHCYWQMYFHAPPNGLALFGDTKTGHTMELSFFPAVASATRDGVLQWFYQQYSKTSRYPVLDLLYQDPTLEARAPQPGSMPLGRAFPARQALISSRSDWDAHAPHCVVFAKAGHGHETHGHADAGQVTVGGFGEELLIDPGMPLPGYAYPNGHESPFYNYNIHGHNLLCINDRHMKWDPQCKAEIERAEFDDQRGGLWQIDLTQMSHDALMLRRSVMHLLPGVVVVLDEATTPIAMPMRLRWHFSDVPRQHDDGRFVLTRNRAGICGCVVDLNARQMVTLSGGRHAYEAPHDHDRIGNPLVQRHEPYLDAHLNTQQCALLTLLAVDKALVADKVRWRQTDTGWELVRAPARISVDMDGDVLRVACEDGRALSVKLATAPSAV